MYSFIVWNPASFLAASAEVYFRFLSGFRSGIRPINRRVTCSWKPPNALTMWGVTTQVFKPKSNTACTTYLKKNPDTHGSDLSLLRIIVILFPGVFDSVQMPKIH